VLLWCVADVLQRVAVCCSVSHCGVVYRSVLQCVAVCCSVLQCVNNSFAPLLARVGLACCDMSQCVAARGTACCDLLQMCCSVLQYVAVL